MLTARAGIKRPHGVAAEDMRNATSDAFSDEAFLHVLTVALNERERRLVETERAQATRFDYAPPERAQTPPLGSTSRPAPTTPERLPLKALKKDVPSGVLPNEEASFRAFVEKAQAWMKNAGMGGELTPEAAMKAWLAAAEAARQRVAAEGGRVEDHPHLRRFWSADQPANRTSSESAAGGGTQAGTTSCELTAGAPFPASAMPAFDLSTAPPTQPRERATCEVTREVTAGGP
jgi:hypothetical protein